MGNKLSLVQIRSALSPLQIRAAHIIVADAFLPKSEGGQRTQDELGEEIGVSRITLWNWRQQPEYIAYIDHLTTNETRAQSSLVHSQLMRLIQGHGNSGMGSIKAIELWMKMNNKLTDRHEIITHDGNKPRLTDEQITEGISELADKLKE